jgi:hypothetical protein
MSAIFHQGKCGDGLPVAAVSGAASDLVGRSQYPEICITSKPQSWPAK